MAYGHPRLDPTESRRGSQLSENVRCLDCQSGSVTSIAMTTSQTHWLIFATFAGPVIGAILAAGIVGMVIRLTRAKEQRIHHVGVSGSDIYNRGVPLDEGQFREVFAAFQAELDTLKPPAERDKWQEAQAGAAHRRLAVISGTFPELFPILANADDAWHWYAENNAYATGDLRQHHGWRLMPGLQVDTRARPG